MFGLMTNVPAAQVRAAIYTRISSDPTKQGLGVDRQHQDGLETAARHGWDVVAVYEDNDRSASNGKARPEFLRMVRDFEQGAFEAVVVWNADRLTRDVIEGEAVIKLAQERGLRLANVAGETDLSTADGRTMFRIKVALSKAETERASERIKRQRDQAAQQGRPVGMHAYGYQRVKDLDDAGRVVAVRDEIDPAQAAVIREAAKRLLAGDSLRSLCKQFNDRGDLSPKGKPWEAMTLRQVLLRDRNAGLRRHRGRVVGKAAWEPIYDEGTHDRVKALLLDPERLRGGSKSGRGAVHLMSGLAVCGRCGSTMHQTPSTVYRGKTLAAKYQCKACMRCARKQDIVDDVVTEAVVERLKHPQVIRALAAGKPERVEALQKQIADAQARLDLTADGFADGEFTAEQFRRITAKLKPQIDGWRAELAACAPRSGVLELAGRDAEERWKAASLDVKRTVIDLLMTVTILPVGPGRGRFHRDRIEVEDDGRVIVVSDQIRIEWKS